VSSVLFTSWFCIDRRTKHNSWNPLFHFHYLIHTIFFETYIWLVDLSISYQNPTDWKYFLLSFLRRLYYFKTARVISYRCSKISPFSQLSVAYSKFRINQISPTFYEQMEFNDNSWNQPPDIQDSLESTIKEPIYHNSNNKIALTTCLGLVNTQSNLTPQHQIIFI